MPGELIPIVLFISIAAIAIFRPLTKKLGSILERNTAERNKAESPDVERIARVMEHLVDRMDRLEERVDFAERMLESGSRERQSLLSAMKEAGLREGSKAEERRR